MLEKIFLQILNMGFTAGFVIIFVLIARLFLKKSPNVLNYKKPAFWVAIASFLIVVVLGFGLATNQKTNRSFEMSGNHLSDLQPGEIVRNIAEIIKTDTKDIEISPDNFGLTVSSDFSWIKDEAIRILYVKNEKPWNTSQLRIFIDNSEFFVTEPGNWANYEGQVFSLQAYLEALKYLPQEEIASLCKKSPQRYAIELSENDRKLNADRCLYYNEDGVTENNGWHIRLDIQPLYGDDESSFMGVGTDIIHVYYNSRETATTSNPAEPLTPDKSVALALTSDSNHYLEGECFAEGHIILGTDKERDTTKIYALTMIGWYGFQNDNFVKISGTGVIPVVVRSSGNNDVSIEYPKDGSYYASSIREMFPSKYRTRIFDNRESDRKTLKKQEQAYAKEYLSKIGRKAQIGDYGDFEHALLTDLGVSVEVSNKLLEDFYKEHSNYPYFIGTQEYIENNSRVVYQMSYHKDQKEIKFTKYTYDSKEILEQFIMDATTGDSITLSELSLQIGGKRIFCFHGSSSPLMFTLS